MIYRFAALPAGVLTFFALAFSAPSGAQAPVPVTTAPVQMRAIHQQVTITGTVTSPQVARLSAATSGLITAVNADEGSRVTANDLLVQLDDELAQLQWQSAQAKLKQAQTSLADAKRRLAEARRLAPQKTIAETVVRDLEAETEVNQAAVEQAAAEAGYQQALLGKHQLRAPFTGVVSRKLAEVGEWVNPGAGVLELVAADNLRFDFAVAEDYLSLLHPDSRVEVKLPALQNALLPARVVTIVPVSSPGARTFLLRAVPETTDKRIIPGMSVIAALQIPAQRQNLVVPRDAILRYPDGRVVVWTVEDDGGDKVARLHVVKLGQAFSGLVEIESDLQPSAQVVVRGNEALRAGQKVRVTNGSSGS
ncbi:efflux RND transporter periplasmic adaptor subunit [Pseudomaricurvus sp. HS19]|uniref:efflux RND transporter periplasmic adaptor subunit n=1 Tax=Pseudomaricurvus sp. HS19 TaxID=2692626 RepID=UPI002104085B|nr:efflux RND transporter periplasmic adaptor subunit [Pseudomaricurvus sp. HS19]